MKSVTLTTAAALMASTAAIAQVETRAVTFENEGAIMSGTLYLPEDYAGAKLPTVVVTGAWTSVQEQMPANYAREMAARGFAAFTFDFRGWGKSGDLPNNVRFVESPAAKTSDIRAAFEFVATLPQVDASQLNGLGICASAGYMVDAVSGNELVQRVGLVAPWLQNGEIVEAVYGGAEGVAGLIEVSRAAEAAGGQVIPAAGPEGAEGVLMPIGGYYYEADRGAIPEYDDKWNNAGWEGWLTYTPADNPQRLDKPLAIVHSESAAIPQGVQTFLAGFTGQATAQWLEDVTQFDFYDNPEDVQRAADTVADHFRAGVDG
ncbi:MAG: alpha/beta hydrolase [Paracoccaceae bacterium]